MNEADLSKLLSPKKKYTNPPTLTGSTLILADLHIPFQDGEFLLRLLELAADWEVTQGVSAGDLFNQAAFSFLSNKIENQNWHDETQVAANVYSIMRKYVPNWLFLLGNHDNYILRELINQIDHSDVLKMSNIDAIPSNYYYCLINDQNGNVWRITHPQGTSVIHNRIPVVLAKKYKMNVIAGHGHLAGMSPDESGDFCCIDSGICCDPERLDYTNERDNTRPKMNQGAVILKEVNGTLVPYLIQPKWADWDALKRLY